jgi:pimeloyl-ACP methyl ester carboxylesterase
MIKKDLIDLLALRSRRLRHNDARTCKSWSCSGAARIACSCRPQSSCPQFALPFAAAFMKVKFKSDDRLLAGILDVPSSEAVKAWALFAHCFTCSKNFKAAARIGRALAQRDIGLLRFDFTGLGESEGDFSETTFSSNVADLVAAGRFMETEKRPVGILIGHSFGGPAVVRAASSISSVRAVVTVNAPSDPAHVSHLFADSLKEIDSHGEALVSLADRPFRLTRDFVQDLRQQNQAEALASLKKPILICHAPLDNVVGIENAAKIFNAAKHPKSFLSLPKADHFLSDKRDTDYLAEVIAAWSAAYTD